MSESKKRYFDGYFYHFLFLFTSGNQKNETKKSLSRNAHFKRLLVSIVVIFFVDRLHLFVYAVNVNRDFYAVHSV